MNSVLFEKLIRYIFTHDIFNYLDKHRFEFGLESNKDYYDKLAFTARVGTAEVLDNKDTIFIKRLLQSEFSESLRRKLIDELFNKYVTSDEQSFSNELYMNKRQLNEMVKNGMYIGSHGYSHKWMDLIPEKKQIEEIEKSLMLLDQLDGDF